MFYIVSGNAGKISEFRRLIPATVPFENVDLDLPEIQSLDSAEIIADKAKRAFAIVGKPVVVEDVTAGLSALNGLPGPFIKYFEKQLGNDALFRLGGEGAAAIVTCTIGYYDGTVLRIAKGSVHGTVHAARGTNGFGFDCCFVPDGQPKTYAEMLVEEKDAISHRALAVQDLLQQLKHRPVDQN